MYACIYELRKNFCGWTGGESKVLQEVLADLKIMMMIILIIMIIIVATLRITSLFPLK